MERSVAFDQELAQSSQVETIEEVDDETEEKEDATSSAVDEKDGPSSGGNDNVELTEDDRVSTFADIGVRDVKSPPPTRRRSSVDLLQADSFSSDLADAVLMIRKISQDYERRAAEDDPELSNAANHSIRMKAVDELLRSHTYAAEMRRAAKSASTWLRSIDRLQSSSDVNGYQGDNEANSEAPSSTTEIQSQEEKQSAGEEEREQDAVRNADKMDIIAMRAMLRSAELKAKEKEDMAIRLNEELSKCRAEIGRLQTASRAEVSHRGSKYLNTCFVLVVTHVLSIVSFCRRYCSRPRTGLSWTMMTSRRLQQRRPRLKMQVPMNWRMLSTMLVRYRRWTPTRIRVLMRLLFAAM